jgi:hypothetical protein
MRRLAVAAVGRLREAGRDAVTLPALSARPRPDSAELNAAQGPTRRGPRLRDTGVDWLGRGARRNAAASSFWMTS